MHRSPSPPGRRRRTLPNVSSRQATRLSRLRERRRGCGGRRTTGTTARSATTRRKAAGCHESVDGPRQHAGWYVAVVMARGPMTFHPLPDLRDGLDGVATSLPGIDLMRYGARTTLHSAKARTDTGQLPAEHGAVGFAYAAPSQPGRPLARRVRRERMDGACGPRC